MLDLLLCAKHLFIAAMVVAIAPAEGQSYRHWTWPSRHAHASQRRGPLCRRGQVRGGWRWRRTAWLC